MTSFPLQANVILQGLVKMQSLNGKHGVVKSALANGRQQVYVEDVSKTFALKPTNLKYQPISVSTLSIKELKAVLRANKGNDTGLTGIDKSELESKVKDLGLSDEKIAETLAIANAPSPRPARTTAPAVDPTQAANQLENMSPEQLRHQAMAMKSMDPNTLRRMNPQFANMSDQQLRMSADQMLMMANNPEMLKQASNQMKNMTPEEIQRMQSQMMSGGGAPPSRQTTKPNERKAASQSKQQPSLDAQYQEASNKMANMSPEELRQQASMMRNMDPDTIRRMNPQLAHMSDDEIRMAASQFEAMAANPEMFKMAMDQMKNLSPEEMENLQKGVPPRADGTSANQPMNAGMSADMLKNMDKQQLRSMLNMVKDSPEMLKQFAGMSGVSEEQVRGFVDNFAQMDDDKLDKAVYMMQKAAEAKDLWSKADEKTGGNLLKICVAGVVIFSFLFLKWLFGGSAADTEILNDALSTEPVPVPEPDEYASEF